MKTAIKNAVGFVILAIVTGINGCMFYPVSKKDVIGTYEAFLENGTPGLPDGGSEILEIKGDGTCVQNIALKDGRKFSATGTWEYDSAFHIVNLTGLHLTIKDGNINPEIEKTTGFIRSPSVGRNLIGRMIIGSTEYTHYEKK